MNRPLLFAPRQKVLHELLYSFFLLGCRGGRQYDSRTTGHKKCRKTGQLLQDLLVWPAMPQAPTLGALHFRKNRLTRLCFRVFISGLLFDLHWARAHFKVKVHHDRGRNFVKSKYLFSFPLLGSQAASGRERRSDDDVRHRPVPRRHAQLGRLLKF